MHLQDELKMPGYIVGFIRNTQVIDKNIIALCVAVTSQLPTVLLWLLHTEQKFTVRRKKETAEMRTYVLCGKSYPAQEQE